MTPEKLEEYRQLAEESATPSARYMILALIAEIGKVRADLASTIRNCQWNDDCYVEMKKERDQISEKLAVAVEALEKIMDSYQGINQHLAKEALSKIKGET
jgi:uncharacterized membrane-anchored protein YhcB (DUF1043 family)